jgi:hypothetical protein
MQRRKALEGTIPRSLESVPPRRIFAGGAGAIAKVTGSEWAAMVSRDGSICAVTFSGVKPGDQ